MIFFPPLLGHLVQSLRFAVFASSLTDIARKKPMITSSSDDSSVLYNEFEPFPDTLQGFLYFSLYQLIFYLQHKESLDFLAPVAIFVSTTICVLLRVAVIVAPRSSKNFVNREISSGRWPSVCGLSAHYL